MQTQKMQGLDSAQENAVRFLLSYAKKMGLKPFSAGGFCHHTNFKKSEIKILLEYLHRQGKLIRLNDSYFLIADALVSIKYLVQKAIVEKGNMRLADCMEILGYGRSRGITVLEYLDKIGFTYRQGDFHLLKS